MNCEMNRRSKCNTTCRVSLSSSPEVVVVSGFPVELAVGVANSGEDAGGVELTLTHPYSMTFLRAKIGRAHV